MREIKFRGKHIHVFNSNSSLDDRWVYGYLCSDRYIYDKKLEGEMLVDPKTVGQYTGLKDNNSKEIYEGDILKCKLGKGEFIAIVEFGNPNCIYSWGWQLKKVKGDNFNTDILLWVETESEGIGSIIIGNIYENPELLKEDYNG